MAGIQDLGNGFGFLYITGQNGSTIVASQPNTQAGVKFLRSYGATQSPIAGKRSAYGILYLNALPVAGTIAAITIGGVNQLGAAITVTGLTLLQATQAVVAAVNAFTPSFGFKYTASNRGNRITFFADQSAGAIPNGFNIFVTVTGGAVTYTQQAFTGGSGDSGITDAILGNRFFINADYGINGISGEAQAFPNILGFATEITKYMVVRGSNAGNISKTITLSFNGLYSIDRAASMTLIDMITSTGGATDTLIFIDPTDFVDGDIVTLFCDNTAYNITVEDESALSVPGTGNILTSQQAPWSTGNAHGSMTLRYVNISGLGPRFVEISRQSDPIGAGVMYKAVYDPDDDGVVVDSDKLGGQLPSYYLDLSNPAFMNALPQALVQNLIADLALKLSAADLGVTVAQLIAGTVPLSQLPFSSTAYKGIYDGSTDTPALVGGSAGDWYWVTVTGAAGPVSVVAGQAVVYNGAAWQAGPIVTGTITINGNTGSTFSLTVDDIPESATKFYQTANQKDAADEAETAGAGAGNRYVIQTDLLALVGVINWVTPDEFADGKTIGVGSYDTLLSLGYNNGSAALIWPKVAADARYTIDVNTMTIDWISNQEAHLTVEQTTRSYFFSPNGARIYLVNQQVDIPRFTIGPSGTRIFVDYGGAAVINSTNTYPAPGPGTAFPVLNRFPPNQADALGVYAAFPLFLCNVVVGANGEDIDPANFGIRCAANVKGGYDNITVINACCNMAVYFNLCLKITNCQFLGTGLYGLLESDGNFNVAFGPPGEQGWVGGTNTNSQTNQVVTDANRYLPGTSGTIRAAHYIHGGYNHIVQNENCENMSNTMETMWYYEGNGDQVENPVVFRNLAYEITGAVSRAGIRVRTEKGIWIVDGFHGFVLGSYPCSIEGDNRNGTGLVTARLMNTYANAGHILRDVCNSGGACFQYSVMWDIDQFGVSNPFDIFNAANWDTGVANAQIPFYQKIRYKAPFIDANQQQSPDTWDYPRTTAVHGITTPTIANKIPQFIGQLYFDTVGLKLYTGKGTTLNTDWTIVN